MRPNRSIFYTFLLIGILSAGFAALQVEVVDTSTNTRTKTTATGTGSPVLSVSPTLTGNVDVETTGVRATASNGSLTLLGRGDGADEDLKFDFNTTANTVKLTSGTGVTRLDFGGIGIDISGGSNDIGDLYKGGVRLANPLAVYASGTVYTLTNSVAKVDFGTTDPGLTIDSAGTYLILGNISVKYVASTYAAAQTITIKIRRTNNTAADLSNTSRATDLPVLTTFTGGDDFVIPPTIYTTANTNDAIEIQAGLSAAPSAGSITVNTAEIVCIRLY